TSCIKMTCLIIFFFVYQGQNLDIHSFPTRRSSDLGDLEGKKAFLSRMVASDPHDPELRKALSDVYLQGGDHGSAARELEQAIEEDRKSTRLNSSQVKKSYAVFCLKKKKNKQ